MLINRLRGLIRQTWDTAAVAIFRTPIGRMPVLITGCVALLLISACSGQSDTTQDSAESPYASVSEDARYVGISECQTCHGDIFETYSQAEMGRSFRPASVSNSDADFSNTPAVYDTTADLYYQAFHRGEEIFLREFRLFGRDTVFSREEKIDFIVGSGQHTNSHIMDVNGFLYQMPLTWYSQEKKWELPPKYRKINYRFSRPIPLACMTCHNAMPGFVEGSENRFATVPHGIDCERCHGPGSEHVASIRSGNVVDVSQEIDYTIVNPGKLEANLQFDICQSCHMQGAAVFKPGKTAADFRPGMPLSEIQNVFWPRSADSIDTFIMASHPDRLKMSECFRVSHEPDNSLEPLTCVTCHNPHVSIETLTVDYYNQSCQTCHQQSTVAECSEPEEIRASVDNSCIDCHMPVSGSSDIPHVKITDHFIRPLRSGEDRAVTAGQAEQQLETYSLASLIEDNPSNQDIAEGFLTYYEEKTNQPGFLDSAIVYLEKAEEGGVSRIALAPTWIRAWFWAEDHERIKELVGELNLDEVSDAWTHYRIGEAYLSTGAPDEAVDHFSRATEIAPLHLRFLNKLASAYGESGALEQSVNVYDRILELNPKFEPAYNNRGFARVLVGDVAGAEHDFRTSLTLYPDGVMALANLASLYYNTGRVDSARVLVDRLITIDPTNPDYHRFRAMIGSGPPPG